MCQNVCFYCATIAYHVEVNADLGRPQTIATSKKNRRLVLIKASGCPVVVFFLTPPPFLVGRVIWKRLLFAFIFSTISQYICYDPSVKLSIS